MKKNKNEQKISGLTEEKEDMIKEIAKLKEEIDYLKLINELMKKK